MSIRSGSHRRGPTGRARYPGPGRRPEQPSARRAAALLPAHEPPADGAVPDEAAPAEERGASQPGPSLVTSSQVTSSVAAPVVQPGLPTDSSSVTPSKPPSDRSPDPLSEPSPETGCGGRGTLPRAEAVAAARAAVRESRVRREAREQARAPE